MRRFFYIFTLIVVYLTAGSSFAQDYQKAKDVLQGSVIQDTFLYQKPLLSAKKMIQLPKGVAISIFGKRGGFLDVQYQDFRGWMQFQFFSINQGTVLNRPAPPQQQPQVQSPQVQPQVQEQPVPQSRIVQKSSSASDITLPIHLNPYLTFVVGGKSVDNQLRLGFNGTYALSKTLSVGGTLDFVFIKGTYFDLGPIVQRQWDFDQFWFNPSVEAGFLYYTFNHAGDKDSGLGFRWALQNDVLIYQGKAFKPSVTMKMGSDLMYFGFDEVRIPFFLAFGASFKF